MAEQTEDVVQSLRSLIASQLIDVNTSIQGQIVSYANGLAVVQPVGNKRFQDGDSLPFPVIQNVPVRWPVFAGGSAGVKGPVQAGDNCLLVFSQQAIDGTEDLRRFDLSDAYAVMVDNAQSSQGGSNDAMVMYFGAAYIKLSASGQLEINAPGGTKTIAPTNELTGQQLVRGSITGQGGFAISGGTSGTANFTGNINIDGTVTNNGKDIGSTHVHSGVQPGGGNTDVPI